MYGFAFLSLLVFYEQSVMYDSEDIRPLKGDFPMIRPNLPQHTSLRSVSAPVTLMFGAISRPCWLIICSFLASHPEVKHSGISFLTPSTLLTISYDLKQS